MSATQNPMKKMQTTDSFRYRTMSSGELREAFLVVDLFRAGESCFTYVDLDRVIVGSTVPTDEPLSLYTDDALKASYFTERREIGILNVGGRGMVTVNGQQWPMERLDALYVGRGNEEVRFASIDPSSPAEFYLLSYPAHAAYPTQLMRSRELGTVTLGAPDTANLRTITKCIHPAGVPSCQLVMGYTQLAPGSVWNTMPPHTHSRRSEVYLYFDMREGERVIHLMGSAHETRNLVIANKQVVVSPGWSIHAGVGTRNYAFCWGMGGENQAYDDMDPLTVAELL